MPISFSILQKEIPTNLPKIALIGIYPKSILSLVGTMGF